MATERFGEVLSRIKTCKVQRGARPESKDNGFGYEVQRKPDLQARKDRFGRWIK